jgi:hypothetical protein
MLYAFLMFCSTLPSSLDGAGALSLWFWRLRSLAMNPTSPTERNLNGLFQQGRTLRESINPKAKNAADLLKKFHEHQQAHAATTSDDCKKLIAHNIEGLTKIAAKKT